jgi:hypothetical protein
MQISQQDDLFTHKAKSEGPPSLSDSNDAPSTQSTPDNGLSELMHAREMAEKEISDLQDKLDIRRKDAKLCTEVIRFVEEEWHFHLQDLLSKEKSRVDALKKARPELAVELEKQREFAKAQGDNQLRRFMSLFPDACKTAGMELDRDCRHPKYTFDERFLTLELNDKKGEATLKTIEGRIGRMPADIPALVEWLKKERTRLFERKFDGVKFLKAIYKAYKSILKKGKKMDGESVPVRDVLKQLKRRADEQNVDLSKLTHMNPQPSVEGQRIDFQQSKDTEKGMLLWKSTGGYIGFITFKAEHIPEEQP